MLTYGKFALYSRFSKSKSTANIFSLGFKELFSLANASSHDSVSALLYKVITCNTRVCKKTTWLKTGCY